jgi:hypothetical protein
MRLFCHRIGTTCAFVAGLVFSAVAAQSNPYDLIAGRNVFRLKDPPPPVAPPAPVPSQPPPKLVLTGIADFSTMKWAFITRTDPGKAAKNYTLTFGENEGGLQLVGIDARTASATVRVDGTETVTVRLPDGTNRPATPTQRTYPPMIQRPGLARLR